MTTPIKYDPEKERYAIQKLAKRTRKLIEKQLDALEAIEGDIPASQLDVLMKALIKMPEVITGLEKAEAQRRKREDHERQMDQMLKAIPAPAPGQPAAPPADPFVMPEAPEIELPFPALKSGANRTTGVSK
jgi:hypothetical protein